MDLSDRHVLITGGTMGIGLATGLAFARHGARVVLTHRWGSADLDEVRARFDATGGPPPRILFADVANDDDTVHLLDQLDAPVDTFVSNVAFALRTNSLDAWKLSSLHRSIDYSAWPMAAYTLALHERFGRYPRYVIGLSSDGPDRFFQSYDFVAMSKAVLETMCRYMAARLFDEDCRVNIVRSRLVRTESFDATFGREFHDYLVQQGMDDCYTTPDALADVVVALCSGLMDCVSGQVIMADRGFGFIDSLMGIRERAAVRKEKR